MSRYFFLAVFFIFFCVNQTALFAEDGKYLDCATLFMYPELIVKSHTSDELNEVLETYRRVTGGHSYSRFTIKRTYKLLAPRSRYSMLSWLSSFNRYTYNRGGINSENSFKEVDYYYGSNWSWPFPVVKVDLQIKTSNNEDSTNHQEIKTLINTSTSMLMVLDKSIKKSSIKEISYLGIPLTISKTKIVGDKRVYLLKSDRSLKVESDYAQKQETDPETRTLQEFFSLYNIPQYEGGMLEFLYPPVQSVVKVSKITDYTSINKELKKFDRNNIEVLTQVFSLLVYGFGKNKLDFELDSDDFDNLEEIDMYNDPVCILQTLSQILQNIGEMYRDSPYGRWFKVTDPIEREEITKRANYQQKTSKYWEEFMKVFVDILNSKSIRKLLENIPQKISDKITDPKTLDLSYPWEKYITGVDDKVIRLKDLLYYAENKEPERDPLYERNDDLKGKALKRIIFSFAYHYNTWLSTKFFGGNCTATIVSSNTIITAAHCVGTYIDQEGKGKIFATHFSKNLSEDTGDHVITSNTEAIACYMNPKYSIFQSYYTLYDDVAICRFPDDTFKDVFPSKVNPKGKFESGIMVGTQGHAHKRRVILMDLEERLHRYFLAHPDKYPDYYSYKSYEPARPGDSGSALFNEDDEIVGILHGGCNNFASIACNMDFINEVIRIDPKVKIRGINQN